MNYCQSFCRTIQRLCNSGGGLPAEYQRVEYIQSSGTQHIVTNVPIASNVETRCTGILDSGNPLYVSLVGGRNNNSNGGRYVVFSPTYNGLNYNFLRLVYDGKEYQASAQPFGVLHSIIFNDSSHNVYLDDSLVGSFSGYALDVTGQQNIALFGLSGYNGANVDWKATGRLYYASFYDNRTGDVIADYIPCYRKSDKKPGMYDLVTKTFFTNAGTGEFSVGNNV